MVQMEHVYQAATTINLEMLAGSPKPHAAAALIGLAVTVTI